MIIYDERFFPNLKDYGIEVPSIKEKFSKVNDMLVEKYGSKIIYHGEYQPITLADLLSTHNQKYVTELMDDPDQAVMKSYELVNKDGSYHRYNPENAKKTLKELSKLLLKSVEATHTCLEVALKNGFCYFLGGGHHHAMSFGGRGFCLVNDIIIAARKIQKEKNEVKNIWIIDVDAHKGCGTAELTLTDDTIHTLSIHMAKGWPLDGEKYDKEKKLNPWFLPSTIDIGIESGSEMYYLSSLHKGLEDLSLKCPNPDLAIIVNGSDPYENDSLESANLLKLTKDSLLKRDMGLFEYFKEKNISQAYVASGGYGEHVWEIHYQFLDTLLSQGDI